MKKLLVAACEILDAYEAAEDLGDIGGAMERLGEVVDWGDSLPEIVCLCGSTRFWRTFQEAGLKETMAGRIVLSIGAASGTDDEHFGNLPKEERDRVKEMLDQLHMRKIELADEVLILNCDGYIGESTGRELAYARKLGKVVRFWEQEAAPRGPDPNCPNCDGYGSHGFYPNGPCGVCWTWDPADYPDRVDGKWPEVAE